MRLSAALAATLLPGALLVAQADLAPAVNRALERARPSLLDHLRRQQGGVRALLCLAAAHDEVPTEQPEFAHALDRLAQRRFVETYPLAIRLMLMAELPDLPIWGDLPADDAKLLLRNRVRGGFTYQRGRNAFWDLSNTQYGALGLRAAVALGVAVEAEVWEEMARAVLAAQEESGGWGYTTTSIRRKPYASMTVAGIAVLRICAQQLGAAAPTEIEAAVARGWQWLAARDVQIGDRAVPSCFYFHYGLERAAILCDVVRVGERDWYRSGADMLLREQLESGAWRSVMEIRPGALGGEGSPVDTAFAILFLRRKFKKELPRVLTGGRGATLAQLDANATDAQVREAAEHAVRRGRSAVPDLIKAMRSPLLPRRKVAAIALSRLTGKLFGFHPYREPAESADAIKAAELWWLREGRGGG